MLKDDSLETRRNTALEARKALLAKFKAAADDPETQRRAAERKAIAEARAERERIKEEERQVKLAEERRIAEEIAAQKAEEERIRAEAAAAEAARRKNTSTARAARSLVAALEGYNASREAYPARKAGRG